MFEIPVNKNKALCAMPFDEEINDIPLRDDQAHDTLDRSVVDKTITSCGTLCIEPTTSLAVVQIQAIPSMRASVSYRTITEHLVEGHLELRRPLRVLPMTPIQRHLWSGVVHNGIGLQWNCTRTNLNSI
ncbi:hypothetical protein TNCV_4849261 [Trichonephila clavipes]|nr:hypothetical protein TNCV_4849261 [Trichonephila clavipes]